MIDYWRLMQRASLGEDKQRALHGGPAQSVKFNSDAIARSAMGSSTNPLMWTIEDLTRVATLPSRDK